MRYAKVEHSGTQNDTGSPEKNESLKQERGISFEEIVFHIERGDLTDLEREEKELLESFEGGEWESVGDEDVELERYREVGRATFRKDRRVNVRISSKDLEALEKHTPVEGIPYQTLTTCILHEYVSGRLNERAS